MRPQSLAWWVTGLALLFGAGRVTGQGTFQNLDFESATVIPAPGGIYASNAIPGWTAYYGSSANPTKSSTSIIGYDGVSLGGATVFLEDGTHPLGGGPNPLQGLYSVLLEGSEDGVTAASIGQSGQIPLNANSLTFILNLNPTVFGRNLQITFNGQIIPFVQIGSTANYDIMGGNISSFSGQTGQLLFTALGGTEFTVGYGLLDNIQFSDQSVPEPNLFSLSAVGACLVGWRFLGRRR